MRKLFGFTVAMSMAFGASQVDARYLEADPLGLVDGPSVYGYALQNPGRYVDPNGLEVVIIWNHPVEGNPFGHCAVAVNGAVWSFGTSHTDGGSYSEYTNDMRQNGRGMTTVTLPTNSTQDNRALNYLNEWSRNKEPYSEFTNNCAHICQETMDEVGVPTVWAPRLFPLNSVRRANRYPNSQMSTVPGFE
jgi:hypothetical protein